MTYWKILIVQYQEICLTTLQMHRAQFTKIQLHCDYFKLQLNAIAMYTRVRTHTHTCSKSKSFVCSFLTFIGVHCNYSTLEEIDVCLMGRDVLSLLL